MELHVRVYRETVPHSETKERHGEVCVWRHGVHHVQSCYLVNYTTEHTRY